MLYFVSYLSKLYVNVCFIEADIFIIHGIPKITYLFKKKIKDGKLRAAFTQYVLIRNMYAIITLRAMYLRK